MWQQDDAQMATRHLNSLVLPDEDRVLPLRGRRPSLQFSKFDRWKLHQNDQNGVRVWVMSERAHTTLGSQNAINYRIIIIIHFRVIICAQHHRERGKSQRWSTSERHN